MLSAPCFRTAMQQKSMVHNPLRAMLLQKLLVREPEERLTAFEALEHKWVQEGGSAEDLPLGGSVVSPHCYNQIYGFN